MERMYSYLCSPYGCARQQTTWSALQQLSIWLVTVPAHTTTAPPRSFANSNLQRAIKHIAGVNHLAAFTEY